MSSVVPAVIDALVTQARAALPNLDVLDGFGVTDDPGDYLMVGVEDPDAQGFETTADVSQDWSALGNLKRSQTGDVTCAALSWNGDADQKAARDAAYATSGAVEALLRADPTLGLVPAHAAVFVAGYGTREALSQTQDEQGALALVVFTVHFQARL